MRYRNEVTSELASGTWVSGGRVLSVPCELQKRVGLNHSMLTPIIYKHGRVTHQRTNPRKCSRNCAPAFTDSRNLFETVRASRGPTRVGTGVCEFHSRYDRRSFPTEYQTCVLLEHGTFNPAFNRASGSATLSTTCWRGIRAPAERNRGCDIANRCHAGIDSFGFAPLDVRQAFTRVNGPRHDRLVKSPTGS
jgi:hypothetical protein